ncbi:MAG: putative secreted protein [Actinobacteria bacterium]|nr:putative secreted protein [Actinomycetota bacterium]
MTLARRRRCPPLRRTMVLIAAACSLALLPAGASAEGHIRGDLPAGGTLQRVFATAASEFHVPEEVLLALSYNVSRWEWHAGPSTSGGYGVMHLIDVGQPPPSGVPALPAAAALLGSSDEAVRTDVGENVRAGAALLARYQREATGSLSTDPGQWYAAIARYSGSPDVAGAGLFADDAYETMTSGATHTTAAGETFALPADPAVHPDRAALDRLHLQPSSPRVAECPQRLHCDFVPAAYAQTDPADKGSYGNYDTAKRPGDGNAIRFIVIHDTELPYDATLQAFQNPATAGSAHYLVRSSDGHVTQVVPTKDVAWHAGNWYVNAESIGIEHEGIAVEGATWYTEALYRSSARLVRYLAERFDIPLDRRHIFGHDEVAGPVQGQVAGMHWDPGPFWDWDHYMELVGARGASEAGLPSPGDAVTITPGFAHNTPPVTSCDASGCRQLPAQPSNFVYLRSAAAPDAPLLSEPALHPDGSAGTTQINDWGDKAVTGQTFVVADQRSEWTAIWYGGRAAWFDNPDGTLTAPAEGLLTVTPRGGAPVAVYGRAYPEPSDFPAGIPTPTVVPLDARMLPGQAYTADRAVPAAYYYAKTIDASLPGDHTVVRGETLYYPIEFNHRQAYVKLSDVRLAAPSPDH